MSDNDRFHRDDPDRAYPRRNMSEGLRNDDPWSVRPGPERRGQSRDSAEEAVNDGVDDAYRVADEHLREGQWRAGSRNQRSYAWRSPGYGSSFGYGYGGRPSDGLIEQLMRVYLDMMGLVGTMMNGFTRPSYPSYPQYQRPFEERPEPRFHDAPDPPPAARSTAVRLEVTSNQPNHIALDLKPFRAPGLLVVPPLRAMNSNRPELRDVELDTAKGRCVLRIRIPDQQPPGLYSGVVVDARTGEPCGTLAIQVGNQDEQIQAPPPKTQG